MRNVIIIGFIFIAAMFAGCTGPGTLEMDYGTSYNNAKFGQILNPEAEKNLGPVYGMDGPAAQHGVDKYRRSFIKGPSGSATSGSWGGSSSSTGLTTGTSDAMR